MEDLVHQALPATGEQAIAFDGKLLKLYRSLKTHEARLVQNFLFPPVASLFAKLSRIAVLLCFYLVLLLVFEEGVPFALP